MTNGDEQKSGTTSQLMCATTAVDRRLRVRVPGDLHRAVRRLLGAHRARLHHLRGHEHRALRLRVLRDGRGHLPRRHHHLRRAQGRTLSHFMGLSILT